MPASIYSRYHGLKVIKVNGTVSVAQRPVPPPASLVGSIQHTLIGRETLEQLAARYYGRADLWWRIADANPRRFPLDWRAGDTVIIPPVRVATRISRR